MEGCFFRFLGRKLGVKGHRKFRKSSVELNGIIEKEFKAIKKWEHKDILRLSEKLNITERKGSKQAYAALLFTFYMVQWLLENNVLQIQYEIILVISEFTYVFLSAYVWYLCTVQQLLRQRQILSRPSQLDKFAESGWRWTAYTFLFFYGACVLSNKKWLWKVVDCWVNYPHHNLTNDIWWYYMMELSLNLSLSISILILDTKRKDFFMMLFHHMMTVLLISLSWTLNFFKVGTLVMLCHDCADIWLESAKMFRYAGYRKVSEILFGLFAIAWIVLRLGYYPTVVLHSITVEAPQLVQYFGAYHVFMIMLSLLLVLNIQWSYFILKVAYVALYTPKGIEDARSDSDSEDDGNDKIQCSSFTNSNGDSHNEENKEK